MEQHLETWQIILGVGATAIMVLIGFFTFLGATLLALVGYFLRNFHNEYKTDKMKTENREEKMDQRMQVMAETFANKLQSLVDKIAEKINQLPKGSDGLSQSFLEQERAIGKRIDDSIQQIQNLHNRIEEVSRRGHDLDNRVTPLILRESGRLRKKSFETSSSVT